MLPTQFFFIRQSSTPIGIQVVSSVANAIMASMDHPEDMSTEGWINCEIEDWWVAIGVSLKTYHLHGIYATTKVTLRSTDFKDVKFCIIGQASVVYMILAMSDNKETAQL